MIVRDVLDLVLRWVHVIAAIMWIGNSLLFNWLDRNLRPTARPRAGTIGEIWLLHSGAFYEVEKTLNPGAELPRPLHWFKWQAYTTWLSGAALLVVVFYMSGGAFLLSPDSAVPSELAVPLGVGTLVGGWIVYELLWRSPLGRREAVAALTGFVLLLATAWALTRVFTGRAAFLHVGALMGTIMAANVFTKIVPAQRAQVVGVERREPPDERLSRRAKKHSIHNNYLTFPVIALMLSSHFPGFYSQRASWIVIAVLVIAGAAVRHVLNVRFTFRAWKPALTATVAVGIGALFLLGTFGSTRTRAAADAGTVSFDQVHDIVLRRCTVCHAAAPAIRAFGAAPGGVVFERPDQIRALAERIQERAVTTHTMPPGDATFMTDAERATLAAWLRHPR